MPATSATVGRLGSTRYVRSRPVEPDHEIVNLEQVSRVLLSGNVGLSQLYQDIKVDPRNPDGEPLLKSFKYGKRRLTTRAWVREYIAKLIAADRIVTPPSP